MWLYCHSVELMPKSVMSQVIAASVIVMQRAAVQFVIGNAGVNGKCVRSCVGYGVKERCIELSHCTTLKIICVRFTMHSVQVQYFRTCSLMALQLLCTCYLFMHLYMHV